MRNMMNKQKQLLTIKILRLAAVGLTWETLKRGSITYQFILPNIVFNDNLKSTE